MQIIDQKINDILQKDEVVHLGQVIGANRMNPKEQIKNIPFMKHKYDHKMRRDFSKFLK